MKTALTAEQIEALRAYAAEFAARKARNDAKPKRARVSMARDWKEALLGDWYRASRPGVLHAMRNNLGPEWLASFEFEEVA